ncbi:acyl-CoA dehydrogenase family protein [Afifella pfennigii]|uniref:acyl-CoA dehydrogenase family protein n=1 Tax=Afifella pfennigii TaxID=209897 RepID=UPI00047A4158|nr:acyl-CoA dehydrogenase family protein [Afifella pfennigii]
MALDPDVFQQLLDTIGRFTREVLVPAERTVEEEDRIPDGVLLQMKEIGLFSLTIPENYGGLGLGMEEEVRVLFEVCQAAPAFRSAFASTIGIGSQGLVMDGTEEQRQKYLPRLARGEMLASFCLTEPDTGSDAKALRTAARKTDGGYVLSGTKRYITNAPEAGLFTVMARTGTQEMGAKGVSAFLVEAGAPGLSLGKVDRKMGHHGAHTCDVIFEDCQVPADALLGGEEGKGFSTAMKVLDRGRIHIAAASVGYAERMIGDGLAYALERRQFGQPIAEFQLVQALLADSRTEALAARSLVLDAARRKDQGEAITGMAAAAKYFASEMVCRVADRMVQLHGGAGYVADYRIEQLYRDVRLFRLYEGTSQIQQLIIARDMIRRARAEQGP